MRSEKRREESSEKREERLKKRDKRGENKETIIIPFSLRGPPSRSEPKCDLPPLKLTVVGKMMLRCFKMPFGGQLDPNMTPTWPSLGPPEGPSDLCFTMVFEHFMFRSFIILRGVESPHKPQHSPNMGPKRTPKTPQIGV